MSIFTANIKKFLSKTGISQLRAVRSAAKAVESNILQKHLQHCVAQSFASTEDKDKKIAELKMLFDRFND